MFFTQNDYFKESAKFINKDAGWFSPLSGEVYRTPYFDMKEERGKYIISMEMPGSQYCSIKTKIDNNRLLVRADISKENDDNTTRYHHRERNISSYKHDITLPDDAVANSLKNEYRNGLLIVTINKKNP